MSLEFMNNIKKLFNAALLFGFLFFWIGNVEASIITVKPSGEVVWKVLGETTEGILTEKPTLTFEQILPTQGADVKEITLSRVNGDLNIEIDDKQSTLEGDLLKEDIVEIEERPRVRKISIASSDGGFVINQPGASAITGYPVIIKTKEGSLMVKTQTGERNVYIMPLGAIQSLLRSKLIDRYDRNEKFILEEAREGQLTYKINGQRVINLFNIYQYEVPVAGVVSAITGEIISVEQPSWLKVFNFLFT